MRHSLDLGRGWWRGPAPKLLLLAASAASAASAALAALYCCARCPRCPVLLRSLPCTAALAALAALYCCARCPVLLPSLPSLPCTAALAALAALYCCARCPRCPVLLPSLPCAAGLACAHGACVELLRPQPPGSARYQAPHACSWKAQCTMLGHMMQHAAGPMQRTGPRHRLLLLLLLLPPAAAPGLTLIRPSCSSGLMVPSLHTMSTCLCRASIMALPACCAATSPIMPCPVRGKGVSEAGA
jgi:hypothetical protein